MQKTTNYGLNKPDPKDYYNIEDFNDNADAIDAKLKELEDGISDTRLTVHTENKANPHSVTKSQIGLGNVDNTSDVNKPISTAMQAELDKKALATDLTSHTGSKSNPHSVTKAQVGLSNVPNVSTNDQTPTYTEVTNNTALVSGEKLSVAFGKIAKAVGSLISHLSDTVGHITSAERTAWNAKLDATASATNSDKLDGFHSSEFVMFSNYKQFLDSLKADSDNRNTQTQPNDYNSVLKVTGLKNNESIGLLGTGVEYSFIVGIRGWTDSSGGDAHEIAFCSNGRLYHRNGSTTTWGGWSILVDTSMTRMVVVSTTAPTDTSAVWIVPS